MNWCQHYLWKIWQYQPIRWSSNAVVTRGPDKDTRLAVICTVWNAFTRRKGQYHFSHEIISRNQIKPYSNHVKVIYYLLSLKFCLYSLSCGPENTPTRSWARNRPDACSGLQYIHAPKTHPGLTQLFVILNHVCHLAGWNMKPMTNL